MATANPILPTDGLLDEAGRRVTYKALTLLEKALDADIQNADRISALSSAVHAGTECMLPPEDKDEGDLAF